MVAAPVLPSRPYPAPTYGWAPGPLRRRLSAWHRHRSLRAGLAEFAHDPLAALRPGSPLLAKLIYGWGNESWSALEEYLCGCIQAAYDSPGPILECGSGLSTLLLAVVAARCGSRLLTLEHDPDWGRRLRKTLRRRELTSVEVDVHALKDYGDFVWYDPTPPMSAGGEAVRFTLVVCDGPPGSGKGGRYGLMPVMKAHLASGCVILLDDTSREGERRVDARWQAETGATVESVGTEKPYMRITLP